MQILIYATLLTICAFVLVPLAWFVVTSLKTTAMVTAYPPKWIPTPLTGMNYKAVVLGSNMPRYFFNSTVVAIGTIVLTLLLSSLAGYATARFNFRGKNSILFAILATSMIPGIAILPSLYMLSVQLGLHDTYSVLIIVFSAWQIPSVVWIMRGFFESIPRSLDEAALVDGCNLVQCLWRIILPISQPGLAASAILVFVYVWNDWLLAITLTISEKMRLVPVGLYNYIKDLGVEWGKFTAYTILSIVPVIVLFLLLQTRFIEGLTAGAHKG
jgi:ABC-type glycerol-3-phosphate transport system permease component